ncbi:MAG: monofunctional biosynthetic peptidoglycan transglycosylase [Bacteroidales bacterium]|nr:monofunctional biosynthetic peptidoglycan transglycosylase [Bacteroidales bacterium]
MKTRKHKPLFRRLCALCRWTAIVIVILAVMSVSGVIYYRLVNPTVTLLMVKRSLHGVEKRERKWVSFKQIPQSIMDAVVASEDNNFVTHNGFEIKQLKEAYQNNKKGKRIRGASTITQQMCKNVFLWEKRSYTRKALEAWFTVWVEWIWSKERIMEVYLNVIEMGPGIYGIEAASQHYFRHSAAKLSREEAALIAAALPSPRKRNPAKPSAYMLQRQAQILKLMRQNGEVKFK